MCWIQHEKVLQTDFVKAVTVIICPLAIAYSMGQIIISVFVSVYLSVCEHSHGRIS